MPKDKPHPPLHYGWIIVLGCVILSATGTATLVNGISVFIKPVSEALGISRSAFSLVYTISALVTMAFSPVMGRILRRRSLQAVMLLSSIGAALFLFLYSRCTSIYQFYTVGALTGFCTAGVSTFGVSSLLNRWFYAKKGLAIGIATAGSGLGSMVLTPVISRIIETSGWQAGYYVQAGVMLFLAVPVSILIIRDDPTSKGLLPYGDEKDAKGNHAADAPSIPHNQVRRMPAFWILGFAILLCGALGTGMQQHVYSYFIDIGYARSYAAGITSVMMAFLIGGKILGGVLFDRLGMQRASAIICGSYCACMACLLLANHPAMPWLFSIAFGLAYTVLTIMPSVLTSTLFGSKDYSANYGIVNSFLYLGMSVGSPISAFFFDNHNSYDFAWSVYLVVCLIVLFLLLLTIRLVRMR